MRASVLPRGLSADRGNLETVVVGVAELAADQNAREKVDARSISMTR